MSTLDRYLSRRMLALLWRSVVALVMAYLLIDLLTRQRANIIKYDVPWQVVIEYYVTFVPQMVYQVAPFSILVASLLVFGDAAQHNEITAALAGGISLRRLARWPLLLALAFAVGLFGLEETIGAPATRHARQLDTKYFSRGIELKRAGVSWSNLAGSWTCHIAKYNRLAMTGEQVLLLSIRPDAVEQILARRIYWDETRRQWLLEDGRWFTFDPQVETRQDVRRITQLPAPVRETPEELFAFDEPAEIKSARELAGDIQWAREKGMPAGRLQVDYYAKFAQPAISFVMIWLAIPFAIRLRRGGLAVGFGAAVGIAIAYMMVFGISVGLGQVERLAPLPAAWLANAVFMTIGVVAFYRTPT
ncbi:MAG: LptF/LptG family permease [Candidatus Hydrogenedentes bacterium]|nr:LptF/LptG family permease [Candidatus Hydrogenedentota bacterium]